MEKGNGAGDPESIDGFAELPNEDEYELTYPLGQGDDEPPYLWPSPEGDEEETPCPVTNLPDEEEEEAEAEVFVGRIPKDSTEAELCPMFDAVGTVTDFRLSKDSSGNNKGYAFVKFARKQDAYKAIVKLNGKQLRQRQYLKVTLSIPNTRLFIGNIPKARSKESLYDSFGSKTYELEDVIIYSLPNHDLRNRNRGFCFLCYPSYKAAAAAKRILSAVNFRIFDCRIHVDWADPLQDVDEKTMSRVKILYVNNISPSVIESDLRMFFSHYGELERVKKLKDFAFIHFRRRQDAEDALGCTNGRMFRGCKLQVAWSKPPMDKAIREEILRALWNRNQNNNEETNRQMGMGMIENGNEAGQSPSNNDSNQTTYYNSENNYNPPEWRTPNGSIFDDANLYEDNIEDLEEDWMMGPEGYGENDHADPSDEGYDENDNGSPPDEGYDENYHAGPSGQGYDKNYHAGPSGQGYDKNYHAGPSGQEYDKNYHAGPSGQGYDKNYHAGPSGQGYTHAPNCRFGSPAAWNEFPWRYDKYSTRSYSLGGLADMDNNWRANASPLQPKPPHPTPMFQPPTHQIVTTSNPPIETKPEPTIIPNQSTPVSVVNNEFQPLTTNKSDKDKFSIGCQTDPIPDEALLEPLSVILNRSKYFSIATQSDSLEFISPESVEDEE